VQDDVQRFFESYREAFSRGASAVAELYSEPCITVRMGVVRVNATRKDTESLFAEIEKNYRAKGFTHSDVLTLKAQTLGSSGALATVRWAYKNRDDETLWETTFSYNLYRLGGAWKILVLTMHEA